MADDYIPPLTPNIVWTFKGEPYVPPFTPNIVWTFGADDSGGDDGYLQSNYMILLTM